MSRKHKRNRKAPSASPRRNEPAIATPAHARKMLYGVIAVAVTAVAFGIYISQPKLTASSDAQAATAPTKRPSGAAALASLAPFHNFGPVSMASGNVIHRYTVNNIGSVPVTITKLYTSCMCTTATLMTSSGRRGPFGMPGHAPIPTIRERLVPGEVATVEIVFDPAAHGPAGVGRIDRTVTLENDTGRPLELAFTATVRP